MPRQILIILLPSSFINTNRPQQSSHDKVRYPTLIGTVIKQLKNDLQTKALQENLSALGIVCVGTDFVAYCFKISTINFSREITRLEVLIFKMVYCISPVYLSFTQSFLYVYAFIHMSFIFNFNLPSSVNNKYKFWRSKFWGLSVLTQVRTSEGQSRTLLCEHIFLFVGRHIFFISNGMYFGLYNRKGISWPAEWLLAS
jgi:hypothetical protein